MLAVTLEADGGLDFLLRLPRRRKATCFNAGGCRAGFGAGMTGELAGMTGGGRDIWGRFLKTMSKRTLRNQKPAKGERPGSGFPPARE